MEDILRDKVRGIVAVFGPDICADVRKATDVIRNLGGKENRGVTLLVGALRAGIAADLLQLAVDEARAPDLARFVERMKESCECTGDEAIWTVESWALSLLLLEEANCTSVAPPAIEERPRPMRVPISAASTRIPVFTVGGIGGSSYPSIGEALEAAPPGSRILVRPGWYREAVVIRKPVELLADGPCDQVVIESIDHPALLLDCDRALVRGLTLRSREQYSVECSLGKPIIDDCDITSGWFAAVAIHGAMTDPVLRKCRIHHAQHRGVYINESAQGTLEECDIFNNVHPGVVIEGGANPVLRRCRIHDNCTNGIRVIGSGQGLMEECDIYGQTQAGVEIVEGGNPTLRWCRIHDGQRVGVLVSDYGRGAFDNCDIFGNAWAGVLVEGDSIPSFQRCSLHDGQEAGVLSRLGAEPVFQDCEVFGNRRAGALISQGSNPTFRRCLFRDGMHDGIHVLEDGLGIIVGCEIRDNAGEGIRVDPGGAPEIGPEEASPSTKEAQDATLAQRVDEAVQAPRAAVVGIATTGAATLAVPSPTVPSKLHSVEQNGDGSAPCQQVDSMHSGPAPEVFDGPGMQAVWLPGSGQVLMQSRPVREPGPGWVRVRVRFCGLSSADLQHYLSPGGHPVVPGHEISGIIDQVGEGVADLREGDRITIYAIWGCETCPECLAGEPAACRRPQGMVGHTLDGGDAEYVNVPASTVYPVPDDITDIQAAILGNAIGTPLHALRRMRINPGETIGVFGLGPLGLGVASLASFRGFRVIAVDGNPLRLNVARALGADHAVDSSRRDFRLLLDDITAGRGLDYALDASGSEVNTNLAMDCTRYGGVVGVVGQKDSAPVYPNNRLIRNEITVVGCYYHSRTEYRDIFRLIREGYSPDQIVTHRLPLSAAAEGFRLLASGQAGKVALFTELI